MDFDYHIEEFVDSLKGKTYEEKKSLIEEYRDELEYAKDEIEDAISELDDIWNLLDDEECFVKLKNAYETLKNKTDELGLNVNITFDGQFVNFMSKGYNFRATLYYDLISIYLTDRIPVPELYHVVDEFIPILPEADHFRRGSTYYSIRANNTEEKFVEVVLRLIQS